MLAWFSTEKHTFSLPLHTHPVPSDSPVTLIDTGHAFHFFSCLWKKGIIASASYQAARVDEAMFLKGLFRSNMPHKSQSPIKVVMLVLI